ncbi:ABC transporter ATP-binding protein [Plesiomonas shigelloides]|uniref:ABC transporter ATP-binding protein n=1 Tax=Plesiomonas shigelloides TaxID=703 RepID=UPI000E04BBAE|nr:ABC transporter ATP-binding protein [Plesiomonas shigelloides]QIY10407.1 ABC transporter ATP-binding protein [Plesiomonas shigelloides]SUC49128.1 Lipoprotein-releasing system ATP-binding protein LolD [Plesiomonas shigelloides]
MLRIEDLHIIRGQGSHTHRVYLPQLMLRPGQVVAVTGESGCGKSTLLEAIGLLLKPNNIGCFYLNESLQKFDIASLIRDERHNELAAIRAHNLGYVLQNGGLLPFLSVKDNILLPSQLLTLPADNILLERIIDVLKLAPLLNKYPAQLSFGERQRTAFARAIIHRPALVLADEPTAALDPCNAQKLFKLFIELVRSEGMMALVVCHDWELVQHFKLPCLTARSTQLIVSDGNEQGATSFVF